MSSCFPLTTETRSWAARKKPSFYHGNVCLNQQFLLFAMFLPLLWQILTFKESRWNRALVYFRNICVAVSQFDVSRFSLRSEGRSKNLSHADNIYFARQDPSSLTLHCFRLRGKSVEGKISRIIIRYECVFEIYFRFWRHPGVLFQSY